MYLKKITKKLFIFLLFLSIAFGNTAFKTTVFADTPAKSFTIFHTNDMHGHVLDAFNKSNTLTQIGLDYVASVKSNTPNSLLIDAGDATQGVPFATLSKGSDVIKLMNSAGYDGMVLGNHEFDYGQNQTIANAKLANFPVISANVLQNGKAFLDGINSNNGMYFIKTINGIKVGFFGITTQETLYKTNPANIVGLTFADPISTSKSEVSKLKNEGAEIIVGIMHIGNDTSSSPVSTDIAKNVDGINIIIDGHSHSVENTVVNGTLIAQTGCYSANLGKIDVSIDASGKISSSETLMAPSDIQKNYTPNNTVQTLANSINASQASIYSQVVGHTDTTFWAGSVNGQSVARLGETNLGDLVADAMSYSAKSQVSNTDYSSLPIVALENGGGVRDVIPAGDINKGQIISVLPFGNILSLKEITPAILYQVIENGVSKITGQDKTTGLITGADGRFPQVSGMRFEYNPNSPVSSRVAKIVLLNKDGSDGKILDRNDNSTKIVLASNDFETSGGDGYTMLGSLKNIGEGNALDVITEDYIQSLTAKNGGSFSYPMYQGRCKAISDYSPVPYNSSITVKNGDTLLANASLLYSVDNSQAQEASTDSNGVLLINNLPSGAHSVRILFNSLTSENYINNLTGAGTASNTPVTASLAAADNNLIADKAAADTVTAKIKAIPENVTLADADLISSARKAYDALTSSQKIWITNYSKLTDAEAVIKNLLQNQINSNPENTTSSGETSTKASNEITLPKTGSFIDEDILEAAGVSLILSGTILIIFKRRSRSGSIK
ncbi:5'-nucleotidase C-terminal domain-containing protein [Clostridium sp. 19966]|uniref:bifunctional metallophosphatase/5'-nucleotidase n=1 Tax=Clostridium sp. 19966 TaxID=2768166 RepID=UPI0028DDF576|nr:5'-nucleotidase C-terminal domain-containing protein [Clostridium sp. 19966]MDT8719010.1 5'-nucleotidase C-terminal domain-containing protein [Clostridium sp. 19966]